MVFHQCNFSREWIPVLLLPNVIESLLSLLKCIGLASRLLTDVFKNLMSLNNLSFFKICGLDEVRYLFRLSSTLPPLHNLLLESRSSPLRNLLELNHANMPNLVGLFYWVSETSFRHQLLPQSGTIFSLARVRISECHKMKKLFTVQFL